MARPVPIHCILLSSRFVNVYEDLTNSLAKNSFIIIIIIMCCIYSNNSVLYYYFNIYIKKTQWFIIDFLEVFLVGFSVQNPGAIYWNCKFDS